jgi:hypothetical protein
VHDGLTVVARCLHVRPLHRRAERDKGARPACKSVTYRSRHLDIGPRDVLSYMLMLMSSLVPLSSSVSTELRGKSYINYTTHYVTNCT